MTLPMSHPINFGLSEHGEQLEVSLPGSLNYNSLLVGMSGSGKTHNIRKLISEYALRGVTVMVLDTQGDLSDANGFDPRVSVNHMPFNYATGDGFSLNPFRIVGKAHGSEKMTVEDCVDSLRILKADIGSRQQPTARALIEELYENSGIKMGQPESWPGPDGVYPHWADLLDHCEARILAAKKAPRLNVAKLVDHLCNTIVRHMDNIDVVKMRRRGLDRGEQPAKWSERNPRIQSRTIIKAEDDGKGGVRHVAKYVDVREPDADAMQSNVDRWWPAVEELTEDWKLMMLQASEESLFSNAERMEGIHAAIHQAVSSGVFSGDEAKVRPGMVNIFDIHAVQGSLMKVLVRLILRRGFTTAQRECKQLNANEPSMIIVCDEIKHAVAACSGGDINWLDRIISEGRKYGLGALAAGQHYGQIPAGLMSNFGTSVMLPMERTHWAKAAKIMRVDETMIGLLAPRRDGLVKLNEGEAIKLQLFAA